MSIERIVDNLSIYIWLYGLLLYITCVCACFFLWRKILCPNFLKLFLDIKKSLCRLQSNKITYSVPSSEGLGTNKKTKQKRK